MPQTHLRITLPDGSTSRRSLQKPLDAAFRRFDSPFKEVEQPSLDRRRILLADDLRRAAIAAIESATRCNPSALPTALEFVRCMEGVIASALESEALPADEREQTRHAHGDRPHTLADCVEALRRTRQQHRPPEWWAGDRGALDAVSRKLDILAGLLIRTAKDAETWAGISAGGAR